MKPLAASLVLSALIFLAGCRPSPEKLLATANKYHDNKKYKEADILYQKVIAKEKTNAEAYYREGLNLLDEGEPGPAMRFLRRAVDLKPSNIDADSKLAEIYLGGYLSNPVKLKNLQTEIVELKNKILKQDPNAYTGLRLEAILDLSNHKVDDALQAFSRANAAKPYSPDLVGWYAQTLLLANKPDEAKRLVRETLNHKKDWGAGYMFLYSVAGKQNDKALQEAILRERLQNSPKDPAAVVYLSDFLMLSGRYDEAETVMKRVLQDKQNYPAGREMLGDFYSRAHRYDQAIQQYQYGAQEDTKNALRYKQRVVSVYVVEGKREQALDLAKSLSQSNPKDTATNEMYASLLLETGLRSDANKSLVELKGLVQRDPSNPRLHLDLAHANLETNHMDTALSEATEAMQEEAKSKNPRSNIMLPGRLIAARVYENRGQHAQAIQQTQQALQVDPNIPEARLIRDQALIGVGEGEQARPDLEKLVGQVDQANEHSPDANQARLLLGRLYLAAHDTNKAEAQFEAVWKGNPPDYRGFEAMQELSLMQGKVDAAIGGMEDLVNKNPANSNLRFDLANMQASGAVQTLRKNPDHAKVLFQTAIDNYKQVLKLNPNSSPAWTRLAMLQSQLGQLEPALASFDQAVAADPANVSALINRGMLLDALGRKTEAAAAYNRVLGVDPENTLALNNLAFINADAKTNLEQAQSFAERAKKRAPNSPDVSDTLGYVYYQRNLNTEALQIFRQDVQEHPENSTFHLHLAMALLKGGDRQGARDEAQKALKVAPPGQQDRIKSFVSQIG